MKRSLSEVKAVAQGKFDESAAAIDLVRRLLTGLDKAHGGRLELGGVELASTCHEDRVEVVVTGVTDVQALLAELVTKDILQHIDKEYAPEVAVDLEQGSRTVFVIRSKSGSRLVKRRHAVDSIPAADLAQLIGEPDALLE